VSTQRIARVGKLPPPTIVIPQTDLKSALSETEPLWRKNLERVLQRAQFVLGEELAAFEAEFARATSARFIIGVGSGTDAIEICLRERGIASPDREVVTSPLTAPFTGLAVLSAGASVRFADIDPETLLLDPASVAQRITSQTAAILPIHLYGQPCPLQEFRQFGMPIIQDACQAHAAKYLGQPLTHYSDWVAYSFYPTKNLGGLGDGGAIATNDPSVAQRIRILRDGGRCGSHVSTIAGINSRLDDLQCCFLRAFLPYLERWNERRRQLANYYDEILRGCPGIHLLTRLPESVNHLYVVRTERRDQLRQHLLDRGIATGIHYPVPLHLQPAFAGCAARKGDFPYAEQACAEIISLPLWPNMEPSLVEPVAQAVRSFYC
jgi:dTDP-4-amino-4,6-dideoxygalactose transaminase